ncbi:hypothetical protein KI387_036453, partial [Taxus chinensis]
YAELRRRLLVDPHIMDESQKGADLSMDNPLSQNPESVWGRFFRNAELERTIDNDLSRLYPEHGSYFQTASCQAILRRILLLRALRYPEYGYRQGMHELLAPLLYVLHVDVVHLSQVKRLYGELFDDRFEDLSYLENNPSLSKNFQKQKNISIFDRTVMKVEDEDKAMDGILILDGLCSESNLGKLGTSEDLDTDIMSIILSNDAYGVEGELGALSSARFMEHDAYCMFDALLSGEGGAVSMADYFINIPAVSSVAELPPVIEASADLYNLLAVADFSLYSHLVQLGVEPQYFALRWLRVLFGREFGFEDLLHVWDAIFEASNNPLSSYGDDVPGNSIPYSPRSAFISAVAVSLLLHLRSSLLATPNATTCLQKLLNFPKNANVKKLINKAKLLQALALDTNASTAPLGRKFENRRISKLVRCSSVSSSCQVPELSYKAAAIQHQKSSSCSPDKLRVPVPESYWEQKWRNSMLQKVALEESFGQGKEWLGKAIPGQADGKNSTNASCQKHVVSNSVNGLESCEIGNENFFTQLNAGQDSLSNNMDSKHKSGTSCISSTRRKLLDDKVESLDLQTESNVINRFCLIEGNDANNTDKNIRDGNYFDHERNSVDSIDDKGTNGNLFLEGHKTDTVTCSDPVKNLNSDTVPDVPDKRSESLSKLPSDKDNKEEVNALASDLHEHMTTGLEVARISAFDKDRLNRANTAAKEEFLEVSDGGHSQSCPQSPSQVSIKSKEPSGKVVASVFSQIGGNSDVKRKQNPSTAAHSGKFRWIWNFIRNTSVEKSNHELSRTKEEENVGSDDKKGLSENSSISQDKLGNAVLSSSLIVHENNRDNSPHSCEDERDYPSQLCEDDGDQASLIWENDGDQSLAVCEDVGDHHSHVCENGRNQSLHIYEYGGDQPLHICEDSDQLSCICENVGDNLFCDHENCGDQLSCNSVVHSAKAANCSISQPPLDLNVSVPSKNKNPSVNLQILGQSMLENIQVIESTFLQACMTKNKGETHFASTERLEHSSMNFLAGKGQAAALVALTKLRKISNVLSQM